MNRLISLFIKDIIENMDRAEAFTRNMGYEEFAVDGKTSYAAVRCLEIIGEAVDRILKADPTFPISDSRKIVDTRNRIIHGYDSVSDDVI